MNTSMLNQPKTGHEHGSWTIKQVFANSERVCVDWGFRTLQFLKDAVHIEPADIRLRICQQTARSTMFELGTDLFFANFTVREQALHATFTKAGCDDVVVMHAIQSPSYESVSLAKVSLTE